MNQEIFLIAARSSNGIIGRNNALPWHISEDLKRFKALTMGRPMVMGRKTFTSLPGLLPGRRHIVLTRDREWTAQGAKAAQGVGEALAIAGPGKVAIIGGAEIYALFLPLAHRIELTEVDLEVEGDTHMPHIGEEWREMLREPHSASGDRPAFSFVTLERQD